MLVKEYKCPADEQLTEPEEIDDNISEVNFFLYDCVCILNLTTATLLNPSALISVRLSGLTM